MTPCPEHFFAVPESYTKTRPAEFKEMLQTFSKLHNDPIYGFQTYPIPCKKCGYFEFKPDKMILTRNLSGSVRNKEAEKYLV